MEHQREEQVVAALAGIGCRLVGWLGNLGIRRSIGIRADVGRVGCLRLVEYREDVPLAIIGRGIESNQDIRASSCDQA